MKHVLTLLSVVTFLAWSLPVTVGVLTLAFGPRDLTGLILGAFYAGGLGASVWVGFFAVGKLSTLQAFALQVLLFSLALFTVSGGVTLLLYWFGN